MVVSVASLAVTLRVNGNTLNMLGLTSQAGFVQLNVLSTLQDTKIGGNLVTIFNTNNVAHNKLRSINLKSLTITNDLLHQVIGLALVHIRWYRTPQEQREKSGLD